MQSCFNVETKPQHPPVSFPYFYAVDESFWSLSNYIDWICKNMRILPQYKTCLDDFYDSLKWIHENMVIASYFRECAGKLIIDKELPETKELIRELKIQYERINNERYRESYKGAVKHDNDHLNNKSMDGFESTFDEPYKDTIMNEMTLKEEIMLPSSKGFNFYKDSFDYLLSSGVDVFETFHNYQAKVSKSCKFMTPAYWGILDLTNETLNGTDFTDKDIKELAQDFANSIKWESVPAEESVQEYFDNGCKRIYEIDENYETLKKLDNAIQYIKINTKGILTEEELKMSLIFPLFRGIFTSDHIQNVWGEIKVDSLNTQRVDMRSILIRTSNKFEAIYGKVVGGLQPIGVPTAHEEKRFLDKVTLMIVMRDSLNDLLMKCKHVFDEQRMDIIVYGWLQVGLKLNFYAMDWRGNGMYRFGLIDQCTLPLNKNYCNMLEDTYCVLKSLENKLLETEQAVRNLFSNNVKGKCRGLVAENDPRLNLNKA
ncbi:unnamed protein product [Rhizophagus irregularis]|nr:unnamed protein product [Rhizophagus irregularis]CAB5388868.1 unnamed protein product [Rhizophagus irregularis]